MSDFILENFRIKCDEVLDQTVLEMTFKEQRKAENLRILSAAGVSMTTHDGDEKHFQIFLG